MTSLLVLTWLGRGGFDVCYNNFSRFGCLLYNIMPAGPCVGGRVLLGVRAPSLVWSVTVVLWYVALILQGMICGWMLAVFGSPWVCCRIVHVVRNCVLPPQGPPVEMNGTFRTKRHGGHRCIATVVNTWDFGSRARHSGNHLKRMRTYKYIGL